MPEEDGIMPVRNVSVREKCTGLYTSPAREIVTTIPRSAADLQERFILYRLRKRKECISAAGARQRTEQKRHESTSAVGARQKRVQNREKSYEAVEFGSEGKERVRETVESFRGGVMLMILAANGLSDLRTRRILPFFSLALLVSGIIARKGIDLASMFPGTLFLLAAVWTREKVGPGDGIVLLSCGAWSDLFTICGILIPALLAVFVTGAVIKGVRSTERVTLPFVPFMCLSYTMWLIFGGLTGEALL